MTLKNFADVEQALSRYIAAQHEVTGKNITLQRMRPLMAALGNPENKLKIIHVAGTSGKTSTAYYVAALLGAADKKVGLTVSPHIVSINERVQINLTPLPEPEFCVYMSQFLELIETIEPQPTYFELLIAFVYWYFAKTKVDYAVIETGLGGLHDATNVASQVDKVCVITDIGIDHTHVLGYKLAEIAKQKAGIIYPSNQVFMHEQTPEINQILERQTSECNATLNVLSNIIIPVEQVSNLPKFQQRNWLLAHKTYQFLSMRDNLPVLTSQQLAATTSMVIPGRMETIKVGGKTLILDGAHNVQKITAFVNSFKAKYPDQKAAILISLKKGKDYETVLPLLLPICSQLVATSFKTSQGVPINPINPEVIATEAARLGFNKVVSEQEYSKAFKQLLKSDSEIRVVTGSFYLVSNTLNLLG